jgi:hypothetical protein
MKKFQSFFVSVVLLSVVLVSTGDTSAESVLPGPLFVVLNSGQYTQTGITTKKQAKVITSQIDYATELANYTYTAPTLVDFTRGKVLLVDMGVRNTGGYSIGVTSVSARENSVRANVLLVKPGPGCIVTQAITNPYQFVYISSTKEILITESLQIKDCTA